MASPSGRAWRQERPEGAPAPSGESMFVEVGGGRMVHALVLAAGSEGRRTVMMCHAAPGSARFDPDPDETRRRGVRLIGVDRPGYGGSDAVAASSWASVDAAADDLAAVVEAAASEPVGVLGWSAGGRVALALAARRPELVDRVVVVGTPAPHEAVPWIPPEQAAAIEALRGASPEAAHAALTHALAEVVDPAQVRGAAGLELLGASAADGAALARPGARERLAAMLEDGLAQGAVGLAHDLAGITLRPWGFEPAAVRARTLLIYGNDDPIAGAPHARWWRAALPDARVEMVPAAGHLLVLSTWRRALAHLAPRGAKRQVTVA